MTSDFVPLLDRAVRAARSGKLSMETVLWTFAASTICVPSGADPGVDKQGLRPVFYPKGDLKMLLVFSSPEAAKVTSDLAPFLLTTSGYELLHAMPLQSGLVVNPGTDIGFDTPPEGLAAFRAELAR